MKHAGTALLLSLGHGSKAGAGDLFIRLTEKAAWYHYQNSVLVSAYLFLLFFFSSQALEDQVWDLLHEADKAAEENKEKSQVYDAMAETLGDAWDGLIIMLEKRQSLLELTSVFFESALEVCIQFKWVLIWNLPHLTGTLSTVILLCYTCSLHS